MRGWSWSAVRRLLREMYPELRDRDRQAVECICEKPEAWGYTCPVHRVTVRAVMRRREW